MIAVNNKFLVSCDLSQKDTCNIEGIEFKMANLYENNYRIKSPTIAKSEQDYKDISKGDYLLCHHNTFFPPSPYYISDNIYSISYSKTIFAKILNDGTLIPICGNILGERIPQKYDFNLPPDKQEMYNDRIIIWLSSDERYKEGEVILARPSSCYDIIYHFGGEQKSITKINEDMVTGVVLI